MNNNKKELERFFTMQDQNGSFTNDTIIHYLKNNKNLYIVLADGGMGKSFLSKEWSKKLEYTIIKSQNAKEKDIQDGIIIDNLDEVHIDKANEIIEWVIRNNIKNIIIFSRPETFTQNKLFTSISFKNEGNIIPRYEYDYKIKNNLYSDFELYFSNTLKIDENEFDFLSILSFNLMSSGVININRYDLLEFIRKYNINNSSSIKIQTLIDKEVFENNKDEIYFKNKTIPSFFVIGFLKKFAHIKNSYLIKFQDFSSQVTFKETVKMIKNMGTEGDALSWDLINNNHFFFMFLPKNEQSIGLDKYFEHGSNFLTKKQFTEKLAIIQILCSNDKVFNGSIYYGLNAKELKKVDFSLYISLIQKGISNLKRRFLCILMFLDNFKNKCINDKELYEMKINCISKMDKTIKKYSDIKLTTPNTYNATLYVLGLTSIKNISINNYQRYIGPIEYAIQYAIIFQNKKALKLIEYFDYKKRIYDINNYKIENFVVFLLKQTVNKIIKTLKILNLDISRNDYIIGKIGIIKIIKYIKEWDYRIENKKIINDLIKISPSVYNEIKKNENDYLFNFNMGQIFWPNIIQKIKKEKIHNIDFLILKEDIISTFRNKNLKYIEKYKEKNFYGHYSKIIKINNNNNNNNSTINVITSFSYKNLIYLLESKELSLHWLKQLIDLTLQIILELDNNFLNENKLHPLIIFVSSNIERKRERDFNIESDKREWFNEIESEYANKEIIKYLSNYSNLEYIVKQHQDYMLPKYMKYIINNMDDEHIKKTIKLLNEWGTKDLWYGLFADYYIFTEAQEAIKGMEWKPENFLSYIQNEGKMKAWKLLNKENIDEIKKEIQNLFKQEFVILNKKRNNSGYSIHWYDNFFLHFRDEYSMIIKKTIFFLVEKGLIEYFFQEFKYFIEKNISKTNYLELFDRFFDWLICLSKADKKINSEKTLKEILIKYPDFKENIENIWFYKTGTLINYKKYNNFNISNFYRYLNDDLTIREFRSLFIREISTEIEKIAKITLEKKGSSKLETNIQKELLLKLPQLLINKYGILLQPESNTYNMTNTKRIDFIFSKNDKYLFVELKTSKDSRLYDLNKINTQLNHYNNSYNLLSYKILIIFKVHNMKLQTENKIKESALANGFETLFITLI